MYANPILFASSTRAQPLHNLLPSSGIIPRRCSSEHPLQHDGPGAPAGDPSPRASHNSQRDLFFLRRRRGPVQPLRDPFPVYPWRSNCHDPLVESCATGCARRCGRLCFIGVTRPCKSSNAHAGREASPNAPRGVALWRSWFFLRCNSGAATGGAYHSVWRIPPLVEGIIRTARDHEDCLSIAVTAAWMEPPILHALAAGGSLRERLRSAPMHVACFFSHHSLFWPSGRLHSLSLVRQPLLQDFRMLLMS